MSNNPWPFVVVALLSLGFLAKSMAQRSDSFADSDRGAAITEFGGLEEPDLDRTANKSESYWETPPKNKSGGGRSGQTRDDITPANSSTGVRLDGIEPYASPPRRGSRFDAGPNARLGGDIDRFWAEPSGGAPGTSTARDSQPEVAQIMDITPPRNADLAPPTARAPFRFQGDRTQSDRSIESGNERQKWDTKARAKTPATSMPTDLHDAAYDRALFSTQSTALIGDPPSKSGGQISANQSASVPTGARGRLDSSTDDPNDRRHSLNREPVVEKPSTPGGFESETESSLDRESTDEASGTLPLWPTMALFASLAANVFFGWIAWDTHARYQDFVEDMSESDTRRERQTRRLRADPSTRRTREAEEAEFLQGGIEV